MMKMIVYKNNIEKNKRGFTLIELSLSLVFISVLSLTIVLIINDMISTYRRGLTLNQINTVGMDLVDDIRSAFQNSSSKSVISECESLFAGENSARVSCENDNAGKFVSLERVGNVKVRNNQTINVPLYGVLCTGTYSYVWNSGYFFNSDEYSVLGGVPMATLSYYNSSKNKVTLNNQFRLLKVMDKTRAVCMNALNNYSYSGGNAFSTSPNDESDVPIELLVNTDAGNNYSSLALFDMEISKPAQSTANNSLFYSLSFILGTTSGGVNVMSGGNFCITPEDYQNEKFDYCAINKFNFAVQATGD